jgi:hypothetical protein
MSIGQDDYILWSPWLHYLSTPWLFIWGCFRNVMCWTRVRDLPDLHCRTMAAVPFVTLEMLRNAWTEYLLAVCCTIRMAHVAIYWHNIVFGVCLALFTLNTVHASSLWVMSFSFFIGCVGTRLWEWEVDGNDSGPCTVAGFVIWPECHLISKMDLRERGSEVVGRERTGWGSCVIVSYDTSNAEPSWAFFLSVAPNIIRNIVQTLSVSKHLGLLFDPSVCSFSWFGFHKERVSSYFGGKWFYSLPTSSY